MPESAVFSVLSGLFLGYQDSNLEMPESESGALPFGDSPICDFFKPRVILYTIGTHNASTFLKNHCNHSSPIIS